MVRLFVCVWLPKELIKRLLELQNDLKKIDIKAKYVEEKNFHVTVTFLGDVEENKINEIKSNLEISLREVNGFYVNIEGLKILPNENYIRVIGIQIKGDEIKDLIRIVGIKLGGSFHENSKITLCRIKNIQDRKKISKFIEDNRNVNIGSFHVNKVSLVKSVLTKQGPKYESIYKIKLS